MCYEAGKAATCMAERSPHTLIRVGVVRIFVVPGPGEAGNAPPACLGPAEKQDALRGAGAVLAVALAVLVSADAASAFFVCLAALAREEGGGVRGS